MKPTLPNPILRLQARLAIARNRSAILVIALASMLFYMLFQAFVQRALYSDYEALYALVNGVQNGTLTDTVITDESPDLPIAGTPGDTQSAESAQDDARPATGVQDTARADSDLVTLTDRVMASAKPNLTIAGGCLLMWVLTAFLSTGRTASELKLIRGLEITPKDALSRSAIWLKAIGHRLYLIFRILLWMIPGLALTTLANVLAIRAFLNGAPEDSLLTAEILPLLSLQGMAGMLFLSGWAYLRYAVSGIILADKPETGVLESVRLSKAFMKGRMGRMILLALVFGGWTFVASYLSSMLMSVSTVLGLMVDMGLSLLILLYYDTTLCVFYLSGRETPEEKSPLSDTPEETQDTP